LAGGNPSHLVLSTTVDGSVEGSQQEFRSFFVWFATGLLLIVFRSRLSLMLITGKVKL